MKTQVDLLFPSDLRPIPLLSLVTPLGTGGGMTQVVDRDMLLGAPLGGCGRLVSRT